MADGDFFGWGLQPSAELDSELQQLLGKVSGVIKVNRGNLGFIKQDNGESDMFVMPQQCTGFGGVLPPPGTSVIYSIIVDEKTGRPRAEDVQPLDADAPMSPAVSSSGAAGNLKRSFDEMTGALQIPEHSGTIKRHGATGTSGFILQDSGEADLFVMPMQCLGYGGKLPPVGARVLYAIGVDKQKGLPCAENVCPLEVPNAKPQLSVSGGKANVLMFRGTIKENEGTHGLISQDVGDRDMSIFPAQCEGFGGVIPPVGTRVAYTIGMHPTTKNNRAESVQPEPQNRSKVTPSLVFSDPNKNLVVPNINAPNKGNGKARAGLTGCIKKNEVSHGFILQDSGDADMFLMPAQCQAFGGQIPPIGTHVSFDTILDEKTQRVRADNVRPASAQALHTRQHAPGTSLQQQEHLMSGFVKQSGEKFGFILQDSGEPDLFMMPLQCEAFGGVCPPMGTRVRYSSEIDAKTGRPKATNVQPEEFFAAGPPTAHAQQTRQQPNGIDLQQSLMSGSVKQSGEKFGFILQDSGEPDLFMMPLQCEAFGGVCPPVGTRVLYSSEIDGKSGRPKATNVQPEESFAAGPPAAHAQQTRQQPNGIDLQQHLMSGSVKQSGEKFGFILQDSGEPDLFMMPLQCEAFGGVCPPVGTRVLYSSEIDGKSGRPKATNVQPEEFFAAGPPAAHAQQTRQQPHGTSLQQHLMSGIVKQSGDKYGFIIPDSGEPDMFMMPQQCEAFGGVCPPVGTRVVYSSEVDGKSGRPKATNVQPADSFLDALAQELEQSQGIDSQQPLMAGVVKQSGEKFGFILQDSGEPDMFMMPQQCQAFGGVCPPIGTRVIYRSEVDAKTGRPKATDVQPEESFAAEFTVDLPPVKRARLDAPSSQNGQIVDKQKLSGAMKPHNGKFGFIQQDMAEEDMFVMPAQCIGFNKMLPEMGTRVVYTVGVNWQKNAPMAEDVMPESQETGFAEPQQSHASSSSSFDPGQFKVGTIKQSGKFGFILQDDGEPDMFVLPLQCEHFGSVVPPVGTRVAFTVDQDAKTGRLRAFQIMPEDNLFELAAAGLA